MDKGGVGTTTVIESKITGPGYATTVDLTEPKNTTVNLVAKAPSSTSDQVRVVKASEYKEAAACLADAFKDDHCQAYFIDTPDRAHWTPEQKAKLNQEMMEYIVYAHCLKGLVTTVGDDYGSVALWMPPGNNMDDLWTIFRSGMWRLSYKLSSIGKKRLFTEFLPLLHATKSEVLAGRDNDTWYLVYIGTRESARGRGHCRRLITHVSERADAEGRACYLESSNEVNVRIYGKMGFAVRKKICLAEEDHELDIMVREPVSGGKTA